MSADKKSIEFTLAKLAAKTEVGHVSHLKLHTNGTKNINDFATKTVTFLLDDDKDAGPRSRWFVDGVPVAAGDVVNVIIGAKPDDAAAIDEVV